MKWKRYAVDSNKNFTLSEIPTHTSDQGPGEQELKRTLEKHIDQISDLQNKLFAENRKSLLVLFQGMDSAGKDSAIKHIMRGVNPQGVSVTSFKHPSEVELEHDYLWRHANKMPEHGQIAIFNRSHYENVLISKVHPEIVLSERLPGVTRLSQVNAKFWEMRYKQINAFEKSNTENGTFIVKIFLHLSKQEQCRRFIDRIKNKEKHWKFSSNDISERAYWNEYQKAYEQAIQHTSTKTTPWYVVPADDKLFAHLLISKIIIKSLKKLNLSFPPTDKKEMKMMKKELKKLMSEKGHA